MMSLKLLLVFAITEFVVTLTPGPAVLLVVSQGMNAGFRACLNGILGIESSNLIYFALSALGLGAVLAASANLFQVIKWAGAIYLIVVGLGMLIRKGKGNQQRAERVTGKGKLRLFSQGMITQLTSPRAVVYFTALLPQFVAPGGRVVEQFIVLGLVSLAVEFPVLIIYGWLAERGGRLIPERYSALPERIAGLLLICAGAGLASLKRP
jgi:homoserine/homoserine lactone efflux protein